MAKFFGSKVDHALFMGVIALLIVGVFGLLVYLQFFAKGPAAQDIVFEDEKPRFVKKVSFPVKIHVAGRQSEGRVQAVKDAAESWHNATKGVVNVDVVTGWEPPTPFNISIYKDYELNTLWFLNPDNDDIALLLVNSDGPLDGASDGNFVVVIDRPTMEGEMLKLTLKHELGHFFGLVHLKDSYPGLMLKDPSSYGSQIGKYDLTQFCHLYPCE